MARDLRRSIREFVSRRAMTLRDDRKETMARTYEAAQPIAWRVDRELTFRAWIDRKVWDELHRHRLQAR
jgi:hypothetical protein